MKPDKNWIHEIDCKPQVISESLFGDDCPSKFVCKGGSTYTKDTGKDKYTQGK
jgi:hypothetical protein